MLANTYTTYGPPSVLSIRTLPTPTPKGSEILVQVHATTVNRTDCALLSGSPAIMRLVSGLRKPRRTILGTDFAGQVVALGTGVTGYQVGDAVFGFDDMGLSSQAQYMAIHQSRAVATIPENITYPQAAASIEGAHYAYNCLNKVSLLSGQHALVNGATGAIGSAVVQLLRYFGIQVTAVCNTPDLALVASLGASQVIDYTTTDFTQSGGQYDYVFDAVGKSTFAQCKPLLKPRGVYISTELGPMAQNLFFALSTPLTSSKKVIFPVPTDPPASLALIRKLLAEGHFMPVIDRAYPLHRIAEAYTYVQTGQKIGNVIIDIPPVPAASAAS